VSIAVWAAAVSLIALAARRSRTSSAVVSPGVASFLRTLGLITYPLYLTHNVVGSAIIRCLINAGLDAYLAVAVGLGMVALVCWFISAKLEPAIRALIREFVSNIGRLPKLEPAVVRRALARVTEISAILQFVKRQSGKSLPVRNYPSLIDAPLFARTSDLPNGWKTQLIPILVHGKSRARQ
jgi:hypothetical protein